MMNWNTIMIIDDTPENLQVLTAMLQRKGYTVAAFPRGKMALAAAARKPPDLILLDINMPEMDGYEVCEAFKSDLSLKDIPIIFISALDGTDDKVRALKCGGVDYINKPFQMEEVYARVDTHLQLSSTQDVLRQFNEKLKDRVAQQVEELTKSQLAMIFALAKLSHTRDDDTGLHLERVQHLCKLLTSALARTPVFKHAISHEFITTIFHASPLHDLGKVGIADAILLKPERLTHEEFEIMKTHTTLGAATLESVHNQYPKNEFVTMGIEIAKYHHEKWDGSGYPEGLVGEAIPLSARIMALVDMYDALRSRRPYKEPFSHEKATAIITDLSGSHFDPRIVKVFIGIAADFESIHASLMDDMPDGLS
ncbi:MAG: two-component system response regulator [Proteobacteria bacterium]|nr:MAG: two-component system response regulator [Pseudomonadota bacterium]